MPKLISFSKKVFNFVIDRANNFSFHGIWLTILNSNKKELKNADVLFWCHDNHRIALSEGKRYAPLIDSIIDQIDGKLSHLTLVMPFSKYFGSDCYGNTVIYNRTILWAYIKRFLFQQTTVIKKVQNDPVIKAWNKILEKINPKLIIGITPSIELCISAKDKNIWIADMQHGILAPGNFYDVNKRKHILQKGWPNEILCWDMFSDNYVKSNLNSFCISRIIGNPSYFSKVNKAEAKNKTIQSEAKDKISVLVTLTWHLPENYKNDLVFQDIGMPTALANYIRNNGEFCDWNLRMHPAQLMKRKDEVLKNLEKIFRNITNVKWNQCNSETLHDAFSKSSVHITFDSASAREAAILGINTAILDSNIENAKIYFDDLLKENKAALIQPTEVQNFTDWIYKSHDNYKSDNKKNENNKLAKQIFENFIDDLILEVNNRKLSKTGQ